jgi:hypothetical protein
MSDVKYIYIRNQAPVVFDENGEQKKTRGFPVGCVAYRVSDVEDSDGSVKIEWGYSVYNPSDKFDKRAARLWAEHRLSSAPKANYGSTSLHINDLLANAVKSIGMCEVHQWAEHLETEEVAGCLQLVRKMHKLTTNFRECCLLTAAQLRNAKRKAA